MSASLSVTIGHASATGARRQNEDFVGLVTPSEPDLTTKGVLAAVADGVSGSHGGREAAEYTVRGLLSDYYATPETWSVTQSLERVIQALNTWVQHQASASAQLSGMATTLTALVVRGRFYYFAHVGDTRLYLLRQNHLARLTTDHVWDRPEMQHVLTRAVGLDARLAVDHGMGELHEGDVLLLASDGVWASLKETTIIKALLPLVEGKTGAQEVADDLVGTALTAGSNDNCSMVVLRIDALPAVQLHDALNTIRTLPVPPPLKPGQSLDGYRVESLIHASRMSFLYKVQDRRSERQLVLKALHPDWADNEEERSAFAHEEWISRRVVARFFPQVIPAEDRNWLYYLTTWHDGQTLQQALDSDAHFTIPEVVSLGERLARALGALHRRSILHRDIKPDNIHLGADGELRLLDLGLAITGMEREETRAAPLAGTPSYLAPELLRGGAAPTRQSDLYAAGVTLYRTLTRHYPYGPIEPFQHPRFVEPERPARYRPDVPAWLEKVLLRAVARDPADRFETAEELLLALQRGARDTLPARLSSPLVRRDPVGVWRSLAISALVLNLLLVYLIVLS